MFETELKKEIIKLSDKYSFYEIDSSITGPKLWVSYKGNTVLRIYKAIQYRYEVTIEQSDFYRLPFSNKLWMLVAEFAMTPVDKRFKKNKYNVIIAHNHYFIDTVWYKLGELSFPFDTDTIDTDFLTSNRYTFSDEEFNELIKYIKTLPDGEFQAKVAEHGKTLIKEVSNSN